jgi:hypothetical protein
MSIDFSLNRWRSGIIMSIIAIVIIKLILMNNYMFSYDSSRVNHDNLGVPPFYFNLFYAARLLISTQANDHKNNDGHANYSSDN